MSLSLVSLSPKQAMYFKCLSLLGVMLLVQTSGMAAESPLGVISEALASNVDEAVKIGKIVIGFGVIVAIAGGIWAANADKNMKGLVTVGAGLLIAGVGTALMTWASSLAKN